MNPKENGFKERVLRLDETLTLLSISQSRYAEIEAEILSLKERLNKIYAKHTGKSVDEISSALERDHFMTADDAKKFGLIDSVVEKRK